MSETLQDLVRKIREVKAELEKNTELQQKLKTEMATNNDRSTVSLIRSLNKVNFNRKTLATVSKSYLKIRAASKQR